MTENLIYHYCSVEILYNIIKYKELWLSDSSYMNDGEEIIWIDKVVSELLEKKIQESTGEDKMYFQDVKTEYEELDHKKHFLTCFSKEKDLLSQWRSYGNDAKGVAIGFDQNLLPLREEMSVQISDEAPFSTTNQLGVENISYDETYSLLDKLLRDTNGKADFIALLLKETAVSCKHPSFKEENETRLIYTPDNKENIDEHITKLSAKLFRAQDDKIVPYYKYKFENLDNFLTEIILGSKCALIKEDLEEYLKLEGFTKTKIDYSSSSYR